MSCGHQVVNRALDYPNVLDIRQQPVSPLGCRGLYAEAGAWMGFAIADSAATGFLGPFDVDNRYWISREMVGVEGFVIDSSTYFPGEIALYGKVGEVAVEQHLIFVDANNAMLSLTSAKPLIWRLTSDVWYDRAQRSVGGNQLTLTLPRGEVCRLTMPSPIEVTSDSTYVCSGAKSSKAEHVFISFYNNEAEVAAIPAAMPEELTAAHTERWNAYLASVLRTDMPAEYNRIAVKSLMTLISNWRSAKGDLKHAGVIPSHAADYFVGLWGWDSWKHAVALARIDKELAKDQVRAMFDYQDSTGMVIDCIYTDSSYNNARDSKPPLAAWAVDAIDDVEFTREIYPQLLQYYNWWFENRDNDRNGVCEFGSSDGTIVAARWESGMDNAVRYDQAAMVQNSETGWSIDQESVDLNAYLCFENVLMRKFADQLGLEFGGPEMKPEFVSDYFFDAGRGYYFDRRLRDRSFVEVEGPEAFIPLWTGIATQAQADAVQKIIADTTKFSTYIPMPTLAADNPYFLPNGYWRGPIWLDQVYFGISGIRKYGYKEQADRYTDQVFTRLEGLTGSGAIYENYDTHNGAPLKAAHFSWSAAHLLMMYWEYNK